MDQLAKELADKGWFEIGYEDSYKEILEKGDLLISTQMGLFDGLDGDKKLAENFDEIISDEDLFTIIDFTSSSHVRFFPEPGEDGWYELDGRIFIKKKQNVEYVTVEIPKHILSEVLNKGGKLK